MRLNWYYFSTIALSTLFCTSPSLADKPPKPRFSANGYATNYAVGDLDLMIPINGDRYHNLYLNPAGAYGSDKQGYADLGFGYRWIQNCRTLLGVYLFGGYSRVENKANLWVVNPGVEAMGRRWDAHLNGYISMKDKNYHYIDNRDDLIGQVATGNRIASLRQHVNAVQHTGNGLDIKLGYQLLPKAPLKGYVGGYYFYTNETESIGGGAVGLEYWVHPQIKTFASYTYDNVRHSTGALGLGIEFGGARQYRVNPCLEERITDPTERYLAELGRGSAIPNKSTYTYGVPFAGPETYVDNIAFFSIDGHNNDLSLGNCTAEHPCGPGGLTQENIDTLYAQLPNTNFYFNGGNYSNENTFLNLNPGQSMHSLTADYLNPTTGAARTHLFGQLGLHGDNLLENMVIPFTTFSNQASLVAVDGENNRIIGSQIGNTLQDGPPAHTDNNELLLDIRNADTNSPTSLLLKNSVVSAELNASSSNLIAINGGGSLFGNSLSAPTSIDIEDSVININNRSTSTARLIAMSGDGIIDTTSTINMTNTYLSLQTKSTNYSSAPFYYGGFLAGNNILNVSNGSVSLVTATSPAPTSVIYLSSGSAPIATFSGTICFINGALNLNGCS